MKRVVNSQYEYRKFCFQNLGPQSLVSVLDKLIKSRSQKFFQILVSGLGLEFFPSLGLGLNHQGLHYITNRYACSVDCR